MKILVNILMCYANITKANIELGWKAEFDIDRMCEDSWRWQKNNPNGYLQLEWCQVK